MDSMRRLGALAGLAMVGCWAAAAIGAEPSSGTTWGSASSPAEIKAVYGFADCAAERDPDAATGMLAGPIETAAGDRSLENFAENSSACMGSVKSFQFDNGLLAGGVAESLLKRRGKMVHLADDLAPRANAAHVYAHSDMEVAGICVARKAPADVAALLSSTPGSTSESAAMNRVAPLVGGCVPHGQVARFSRPGMRALLAVSAYRIVMPSAGDRY